MAKDSYRPEPLPPLKDVLATVRGNQEQREPASRKLSAEELVEQLKEHFGKGDLAKLVTALGDSVEFERTTICPILVSDYFKRNGKIKIVRAKNGSNNIICPFYLPGGWKVSTRGEKYPEDIPAQGCSLTRNSCGYADAEVL